MLFGIGGSGNQRNHALQQFLIFRIYQKHLDAQTLQSFHSAIQLNRQDYQIRFQSGAALQIEFLGSTHIRQRNQLGRGQLVNGPLFGLCFDTNQLIRKAQGNQCTGGDIIAADKALGFLLNCHLAPRLIRYGNGIVAHGNVGFGSSRFRGCGFGSGGFRDGGSGDGGLLFAGLTAGCQGQQHHKTQQQGKDFFHVASPSVTPEQIIRSRGGAFAAVRSCGWNHGLQSL